MKFSKLKCLVVEDEKDVRETLIQKLASFDELEVIGFATNVEDSYNKIVNLPIDFIFLDVRLIGGNAFTLLELLRKNGKFIPPIVMTSGRDYAQRCINNFRGYVVYYLNKPFWDDFEEKIQKSINAVLEKKSKLKFSTDATLDKESHSFDGSLFFRYKSIYHRIPFHKITYIQSNGEGGIFIAMDGGPEHNKQTNTSLAKISEKLPVYFRRASKDKIINSNRISIIDSIFRTVELDCKPKNISVGVGDAYFHSLVEFLNCHEKKS